MTTQPKNQGRHRRDHVDSRALRITGMYGIAAAVIGAIVAALVTKGFSVVSPAADHTPASAVGAPTLSAAAIDQRYDGKDPEGKDGPASKCADPPASQPISQDHPVVIGPAGDAVGYVELRTSPICPVIWARVYWFTGGYRMPTGWSLDIRMRRPADHKTIVWVAYDTSEEVYGNMLATVTGCVEAEVYFVDGQRHTPPAVTPCLRSS